MMSENVIVLDRGVGIRLSEKEFSALVLRDACRCAQCVNVGTDQRLYDISDLPKHMTITYAACVGETLRVVFAPEGHEGEIPWRRLLARAEPRPKAVLWCGDDRPHFARQTAEALEDPVVLKAWLHDFMRAGVAFATDVPCDEGEVARFGERFAYVRGTNYGRVFDVRAVANHDHLAYSDAGLLPHTDNPYRDPVPGVQLLHCLQAAAVGGETVLIDGFAVAEALRRENPEAFALLTNHSVLFRYHDRHCDIQARQALISLDDIGVLRRVIYNNRAIQPIDLPGGICDAYVAAYRRFAVMLKDPQWRFGTVLKPGDLMMFDNERLLHGRSAYDGTQYARHLQGCYVDHDAIESAARL